MAAETADTDDFTSPTKEHYLAAQEAIGAALQASEARGVDRKHYRTGLWQAAIQTLIAAGDLDVLVDFLEDRTASIRGHGHNADAPPLRLDPSEVEIRKAQATLLAEIISGHLEPLMLSFENQRVDGVSVVVDTILTILSDRWGPTHLRRILRQQAQAFRDGDESVILPLEPSTPNRQKERAVRPAPIAAPADAIPPLLVEPIPQVASDDRQKPSRPQQTVDIHIRTDVDPELGIGVYGIAVALSEVVSGRREIREIDGVVTNDLNGRRTHLTSCIDVLSTLGGSDDDSITISTSAAFIVEEMSAPQISGLGRFEHESDLWQLIDTWSHGRTITWVQSNPGIGSPLAQRSDRLVRERLTIETSQERAS